MGNSFYPGHEERCASGKRLLSLLFLALILYWPLTRSAAAGAIVGAAVGPTMGVTVTFGVTVGPGATVGVGVGVAVGVGEAVDGTIAAGVTVGVGAAVEVAAGVAVEVATGVGVTVGGGVAGGVGVMVGVSVGAGVAVGVVDWCPSQWQRNKTAKPSLAAFMATRAVNSACAATPLLSSPEQPQNVVFGPRARLLPWRFK